jgi:hypothetical protein
MNRELEKLVQQYADLYPYDPTAQVSSIPLTQAILNEPNNLPPAQSIDIPVEQRPLVLNPIAKDLQLLPPPPQKRTEVITTPPSTQSFLSSILCGENLTRIVLISILVICLILYFRKK